MIIKIPRPATKPNQKRPANLLLQHQVRRLREIELHSLIPAHRTDKDVDASKMTEGEASRYIAEMTAKLHSVVRSTRTSLEAQKIKQAPKVRKPKSRAKKKKGTSATRRRK